MFGHLVFNVFHCPICFFFFRNVGGFVQWFCPEIGSEVMYLSTFSGEEVNLGTHIQQQKIQQNLPRCSEDVDVLAVFC